MNPIEAVTSVLRNYANFRGRAQRSEFSWFFLSYFAFAASLAIVLSLLPTVPLLNIPTTIWSLLPTYLFIGTLLQLGLMLPSWGVASRRLHDTNRSARWLIAPIILQIGQMVYAVASCVVFAVFVLPSLRGQQPEIGAFLDILWTDYSLVIAVFWLLQIPWTLATLVVGVVLIVILALPGTHGANRYGLDPLLAEPQPD